MKKEEFIVLAGKISDGTATEQDITLYNAYYNHFQQNGEWDTATMGDSRQLEAELKSRIDQKILLPGKSRVRVLKLKWIAAAAILLMVSSWGYLYLKNTGQPHIIATAPKANIKPGAVLMLADGSRIALNSTKNGVLAQQGDVSINKLTDGRLVYQSPVNADNSAALQNKPELFNSITTPRGAQLQVDLPDGTRVWLNSASTLRYPATFKGGDRVVRLSGEAYFEVAHKNGAQKAIPFKVIVNNNEEVQVLGTHFNVMAYLDENQSKTTLLEGSVKIVKGNKHRLIMPGEQAQVNTEIKVSAADIEETMAWKNGQILFKDKDLKAIMRQVSRYYDVDVNYNGTVPKRLFTGGISINAKLASLLKILELNNIHFIVHGRTITVTP